MQSLQSSQQVQQLNSNDSTLKQVPEDNYNYNNQDKSHSEDADDEKSFDLLKSSRVKPIWCEQCNGACKDSENSDHYEDSDESTVSGIEGDSGDSEDDLEEDEDENKVDLDLEMERDFKVYNSKKKGI